MLRAVRSFLDQAPELRPWSLKFRDAWLERRFQDTYLQYIRIATFLGAVTWAASAPSRSWSWNKGSSATS